MESPQHIHIALQPRTAGSPVPLTAGQLIWWNHLSEDAKLNGLRMCAASARIFGPLQISLLRQSIEAVVERHESLRTRVVAADGVPLQQVDATGVHLLEVADLTKVDKAGIEVEAKRLGRDFIEKKVALSVGPLFEAKILKLSRHEHVLLLALDHLVSDAVSYKVLNKEVWISYNQVAKGLTLSLPPPSLQFPDYAIWQERTYESWLHEHGAYWRKRLCGARPLRLPPDFGLADTEHPANAMMHFTFGKTLSDGLRNLARREGALLSLVFLTVYVATLSSWCRQEDFVLKLLSHGRYGHRELANMIGLLRDHLHLRIEMTQDDNFLDLLRRLSSEFYSASLHHDFDRVPGLIPECVTDALFNWVSTVGIRFPATHQLEVDGALRVQPFPLNTTWPMEVRFLPFFFDTPAGVNVTMVYQTNVFARNTIERFVKNLRTLATEFALNPLARVRSASIS